MTGCGCSDPGSNPFEVDLSRSFTGNQELGSWTYQFLTLCLGSNLIVNQNFMIVCERGWSSMKFDCCGLGLVVLKLGPH